MRDLMIRILINIYNRIVKFYISKFYGVVLSGRVKFNGLPSITVCKGASIIIGDGSLVNSSNHGYHVNMFNRVKLMADRNDAVIRIGNNTRIHGSCLHAYNLIEVGNRCLIAANCQIIDCNGHELSMEDPTNRINTSSKGYPVIIEDDVWIGTGAIILPGVRIGRGSIVAAGSVVSKSIPPMAICAGNPAKVIRRFGNVEIND